MERKRFIEVSLPVKELSEISAKEKNIRHGHISTLHIWWARRPLASSRATNYAALIPAPESTEEWNAVREFIINFAKWENSLNPRYVERARRDVLKANGGKPPRVLDPFSGGGSIPLEAMRLGCETHAIDYNPVAVLILKCTLEYPQKFGKPRKVKVKNEVGLGYETEVEVSPLLADVKKWGEWVLERAREELEEFYPPDEDGSVPVGYIWARTVPCQNPACGAEIPLMRQFWLAKKNNKRISLYPYVEDGKVKFKIVGDGYEPFPKGFDPSKGTVARAVATCPVCGFTVDAKTTRRLFQEGKASQRMVAVVLHKPGEKGKRYRLATERDVEIFLRAEEYLKEKREKLMEEWGIDPVPDEEMPPKETLGFRVQRYGMLKWGDLFNSRQKLALITFTEKVKLAHKRMLEEGYDEDYAKAITTYLSLLNGKLADWNCVLSVWRPDQERNEHLFNRQALPMVWDYGERVPFHGSLMTTEGIKCIISHLSKIPQSTLPTVRQSSATSLPYPDDYFDAVFTDPPYYDNVPYSYLSDFFYVWLKRSVGDLYPELFITPLTPKTKEIVAYSHREGGQEAGRKFFEEMLKKAFKEISRVLKPDGIATIVYTHKSTSGWETLINSLLQSDLVVTASWPINTEMKSRLRARESAALASSIYFVCRKAKREETGWFNEVKEEIKQHLQRKLQSLWEEGVSGADFFIAAIGSSIEVFGKYEKVMDYEGNEISAGKLLEYVREVVTDYAVKQILHDDFSADLSPLTRFYLLYRWTYGENAVHFDEARKLAQSTGLDLEKEWGKGVIKKEKENVRVLGPQNRKLKDLEEVNELIDVLHRVLLLWKAGDREDMKRTLLESGYWDKESFYKIAQAISETLNPESGEKKLLDGFLSGKGRLKDEIRAMKEKTRPIEWE